MLLFVATTPQVAFEGRQSNSRVSVCGSKWNIIFLLLKKLPSSFSCMSSQQYNNWSRTHRFNFLLVHLVAHRFLDLLDLLLQIMNGRPGLLILPHRVYPLFKFADRERLVRYKLQSIDTFRRSVSKIKNKNVKKMQSSSALGRKKNKFYKAYQSRFNASYYVPQFKTYVCPISSDLIDFCRLDYIHDLGHLQQNM